MEEFYQQIKDNLNNRPPVSFEESAWEEMNQKLDQHSPPQKKRGGGFWFWPLLLGGAALALLLGSNAYLFYQVRQLSNASSETIYHRDTIYQTSILYQTDTVYQTKVIYQQTTIKSAPVSKPNTTTLFSNYFSSVLSPQGSYATTLAPPAPPWQNQGLHAFAKWNNPLHHAPNKALDKSSADNERFPFAPFSPLPQAPIDPLADFWDLSFPEDIIPVEPYRRKRPGRALAQALKPRTLHAGLSTGFALAIRPKTAGQKSFNFSLEGALGFSSGMRLFANATFLQQNYKVDEMGDDIRVPVLMPPSDDFSLKYVEISGPALQYFAGLEYLFNRQQKWQPLLGLAYGASSVWNQEWKYEFENDTGTEFEEIQNFSTVQSLTDFLLFRAGTAYRLNDQFNLRLQGNYRYPYRQNRTSNFSGFLSIDGGVYYDF